VNYQIISRHAGRIANQFLAGFGLELVRRRGHPPWNQVRKLPQVHTLIDVGIGKGTFGLYQHFPSAYLLLIEPLDESREFIDRVLEKREGRWARVALGRSDGHGTMLVNSKDIGKSGLLVPTELHKSTQWGSASVLERSVVTSSLDEVIVSEGVHGPYGVKIDVEGMELDVLKGGGATLDQSRFVIVETSIRPRFDNGASFGDVYRYLYEQGFEMEYILSANTADYEGTIRMCDVAFVKQ